jgi:hypothetical protein
MRRLLRLDALVEMEVERESWMLLRLLAREVERMDAVACGSGFGGGGIVTPG